MIHTFILFITEVRLNELTGEIQMAKGNQEPGTAPPAVSQAPPFTNGILDDLQTDFILKMVFRNWGIWETSQMTCSAVGR